MARNFSRSSTSPASRVIFLQQILITLKTNKLQGLIFLTKRLRFLNYWSNTRTSEKTREKGNMVKLAPHLFCCLWHHIAITSNLRNKFHNTLNFSNSRPKQTKSVRNSNRKITKTKQALSLWLVVIRKINLTIVHFKHAEQKRTLQFSRRLCLWPRQNTTSLMNWRGYSRLKQLQQASRREVN